MTAARRPAWAARFKQNASFDTNAGSPAIAGFKMCVDGCIPSGENHSPPRPKAGNPQCVSWLTLW